MLTSVDFTFLKITNASRRNIILFERNPEPEDTLRYFQRSQKIHRTHFTATRSKAVKKSLPWWLNYFTPVLIFAYFQ